MWNGSRISAIVHFDYFLLIGYQLTSGWVTCVTVLQLDKERGHPVLERAVTATLKQEEKGGEKKKLLSF